jgi:hypothetical protein
MSNFTDIDLNGAHFLRGGYNGRVFVEHMTNGSVYFMYDVEDWLKKQEIHATIFNSPSGRIVTVRFSNDSDAALFRLKWL